MSKSVALLLLCACLASGRHVPTRARRQAGSFTVNSDGTSGAALKVPLTGNDKNVLSAIGSADFNDRHKLSAASAGLALDNVQKVGASLSAAHSDVINRNDYSAGGKLNLFRSPSSSLDFNAGFKKFDTPFYRSSWEPNVGFSFSKFF